MISVSEIVEKRDLPQTPHILNGFVLRNLLSGAGFTPKALITPNSLAAEGQCLA